MDMSSPPNTTGLETAYDALKDQFKTINRILRDTNIKLNSKVGELDVLTYHLNSILSHMSQGLLFINLNGDLTTCNAVAEEILAVDSLNILFHPFADHFRDDFFGFSIKEALATKKVPKRTFTLMETSSGIQKELEVDATFILKDEAVYTSFPNPRAIDSLQGLIILMRDISDLHRLQTQANRNDRMKALGEMAAMVAHEIRNPLGGIKGFASLLQRDLKEQPHLQQLATYIVEGTDSLNRLVTNVLNYARPLQTNIVSSDMVKILKEICEHIRADESLNPRIEILTELPEVLLVPVDVHVFKSAMLNLIVNGIQAMAEGGTISLSLTKDRSNAIINISDTGAGISPENLKKIFSPFFTTKSTGNGFGLAEVDQAIRAHAGTIDVDSVLGQGTTFTIRIPLKAYGAD